MKSILLTLLFLFLLPVTYSAPDLSKISKQYIEEKISGIKAPGIIVGVMLIIGSVMCKGDKVKTGGVLLIVFGALGLITVQGWVVGPILGLIGGILAVAQK